MLFALVLGCFFLSGVAGLVYEVVWARYLALSLGHTSYAVVAVLVAFLGGLGLGNYLAGLRADRLRRPLALYGSIEIAVGLLALGFPAYYELMRSGFLALARSLAPGGIAALSLKLALALLTILLPCVLMGATLPLLAKFVTRSLEELRGRVGRLYFINSAGAVTGCLLADFWWIPASGLKAALFSGAALNLAAGAAALWISRRLGEGQGPLFARPPPGGKLELALPPIERQLAVVAIALSGFVAMLLEVAWMRLLALVLGSSTHAFSLMLVTFIAGIAAGSWLVSGAGRWPRPLAALAWAELALAATLAASLWSYEWLPYWFSKLAASLPRREEAYALYGLRQAAICVSVMFLPAVCLGAALPLACRAAASDLGRAARTVGSVFAANTLGTVLGAALTGFWLLPALGLARTFGLGAGLSGAIGLAILSRRHWRRRPAWLAMAPLLVLAASWTAGQLFDPSWRQALTLSLWRFPAPPQTREEFRARMRENDLRFYRDGAGATVTVNAFRSGGAEHLNLKVNGKSDASTAEDMPTQLLLGHLPMLLCPHSERALVIGLGSGMTCSAVARHPSIRRIDAVELSPEVVEAARLFDKFTGGILDDPRVRVVVDDAKSFLEIAAEAYDVIISEPSNPWMAGVAGLFSKEFYESCRRRLAPGGLMVQWVQLYEMSDEVIDICLATFGSVFGHFSVWQSSMLDLLLAGGTEPLRTELSALEARFAEPGVKRDLERIHLASLPALLACEVLSPESSRFFPPPGTPLHSDYFPVLEFAAQKALFVQEEARRWRALDERLAPRPATLLGRYLPRRKVGPADARMLARCHLALGFPPPALVRSLLVRWQDEEAGAREPRELLSRLGDPSPSYRSEVERLSGERDALLRAAPEDPRPLRLHAMTLLEAYRADRSAFYIPEQRELRLVIERLLESDPAYRRTYRLQLAELAWDRGDDELCLRLGEAALHGEGTGGEAAGVDIDPPAGPHALTRMVEAQWRRSNVAEAWALFEKARQAGFIPAPPAARDYRLELAYRKVRHGVEKLPLLPGSRDIPE
jgi:spermidine synthase